MAVSAARSVHPLVSGSRLEERTQKEQDGHRSVFDQSSSSRNSKDKHGLGGGG